MSGFDAWMERMKAMKDFDPEAVMPENLVVGPASATWLDAEVTGNPSRIGVLADVPARAMELYLQEIPAGQASDLQRHPHESVHYVLEGEGRSEIGARTLPWARGDLVYTPPWVWHRHYAGPDEDVRMLLVESSPLLDHLGLAQRESAGLVTYEEFRRGETQL